MRVLAVTTSFPRYAGDFVGHFVAHEMKAISRFGHDVTVLCPHGPGLALDEQRDGLRIRRFRYAPWERVETVAYGTGIPANLRTRPSAWLSLPSFLWSFRRAIKRHATQVDLIHAHWAQTGWIAAPAAQETGVPLLLTLYGSDVHLPGTILGVMRKRALTASRAVLCVSRDIARKVEPECSPAVQPQVLPNAIDESDYESLPSAEDAKKTLGIPQNTLLLLTAGRLAPEKDHACMIRAIAAMTPSPSPWTIAILGEGPERNKLQSLAEQLGVAQSIRFIGSVPQESIPCWMAAADIFLLPSRHEGLSLALLEAMAAGCAVVSSNVGGAPDVLTDGVNGLLVSASDSKAFARALELLLQSPSRRKRLGQQARKTVMNGPYTWNAHALRLDDVYRSCFAQESANHAL